MDLQQLPGSSGDLPEVPEVRPVGLPSRSTGTTPRRDLHAEPHTQRADHFAGEGDECHFKRSRHLPDLPERNRQPDRWASSKTIIGNTNLIGLYMLKIKILILNLCKLKIEFTICMNTFIGN